MIDYLEFLATWPADAPIFPSSPWSPDRTDAIRMAQAELEVEYLLIDWRAAAE